MAPQGFVTALALRKADTDCRQRNQWSDVAQPVLRSESVQNGSAARWLQKLAMSRFLLEQRGFRREAHAGSDNLLQDADAKVGECLLKGDISYLDLPRKRVTACRASQSFSVLTFRPLEVVVDYSSPNIAKEMHVGHLRQITLSRSPQRWRNGFQNSEGLLSLANQCAECLNFAAMKSMVCVLVRLLDRSVRWLGEHLT